MNFHFNCKIPTEGKLCSEFEFLIELADTDPICFTVGKNLIIVHEREPLLKFTLVTIDKPISPDMRFVKYTARRDNGARQEILIRSIELDSCMIKAIVLAISTFFDVTYAQHIETFATGQFTDSAVEYIDSACDTQAYNMDDFPFSCPWCGSKMNIPISLSEGIDFTPFNIKEQANLLCQECNKPIQKAQIIMGLKLALAKWTDVLTEQLEYFGINRT